MILTNLLPVNAIVSSKTISGWSVDKQSAAVDADFYIDGTVYASGKGSFKLVNRGGGWIQMVQNVGIKKGKTYVLELDARSDNTKKVQTMFKNYIRNSLVPLSGTYEWTHFSFEYSCSANENLEVGFVWEAATDGFWMDNITFYDKSDETETNLLKNGTFDEGMKTSPNDKEAQNTVNDKKIYFYEKEISIDGDLSDWSEIEPFEITRMQSFTSEEIKNPIKGNVRFACDDENFYIALEAEDDIHYAPENVSYWENDGVQFAVAALGDSQGQEFGVTYDDKNDKTSVFGSEAIAARCKREGNKTVYEMAFPWNVKFGGGRPDTFLFNALISDNDGDGRKYCIEMAPGISAGKFLTDYKNLIYLDRLGELGYSAEIPSEYTKDVKCGGSIFIKNNSAETKEAEVSCEALRLNRKIKLAGGESQNVDFGFTVNHYDGLNVSLRIACDGEESIAEKNIQCAYSEKDFGYLYDKLSGYKNELADLLFKCDQKDVPTDYELLNYSVMDKFLTYMKDEAEHNYYAGMNRYNTVLTELYENSKANMEAYLSGEKETVRVPKYVTSKVTTDGVSVIAKTFDGKEEKESPVFFVGYGHWDTPREEIPFFTSIGTNIIQAEGVNPIKKATGEIVLGENATEFEKIAAENGWELDYTLLNSMKADLKRAAENNVLVSVNISPGIPSFVSDTDASIKEGGGQFLGFNVDHSAVRNYVELYARIIAHELKDCDALFDLCITNEPSVYTFKSTYFAAKWQQHIMNKYGTIEKLNDTYGSDYANFGEVTMPDKFEHTPLFYDWMKFNDSHFADFHNWFAGVIKEEAPNIKVECKIMDYFDGYYNEDIRMGSDYELIAEAMDVNGCDACAYYNVGKQPLYLKMGWYDYMTSVKDAPVWNTEDHIITDSYVIDYGDIITPYTASDIWNGAVHGRGASIIWIWDKRDASMPWGAESGYVESFQSSNFVLRPKEVAEIGRTTLDLNRLAEEITAIQKAEPKVGLLYSRTSLVYNESGMDAADKAYKSIICNGQKVRFVTDSKPEDMHKCDVLVVPASTNVPSEVLDNISEFVNNGGTVIVADENSLKRDEYNKEYGKEKTNRIFENAVIVNIDELENTLAEVLEKDGISEVVLVDAETGKKADGVEWSYAEKDGKIVVNILNYGYAQDKTVKIISNGKEVKSFKELRENKSYDGEITLKGYEPVLIEFSK